MTYTMLNEINLADRVGDRVGVIFLAKDVYVADQKNGGQYISLTMKCKDIELNAKKFGVSQKDIDLIKPGQVYQAQIDVQLYGGSIANKIYNIEHNDSINKSVFIEWADGLNKSAEIIQGAIKGIENEFYKKITFNILSKKWDKFIRWPAASGMHHAVLGGLTVHTAEVVSTCIKIADFWNEYYGEDFIDKDLLISAAILHDIGKIEEFDVDVDNGVFSYSDKAALESHIVRALIEINTEAVASGLLDGNEERLDLLTHCIAAHHGKKEYGSPVEPSIPEAYILSKMDDMSAEMFKYNKELKGLEDGKSLTQWNSAGMRVTYKRGT